MEQKYFRPEKTQAQLDAERIAAIVEDLSAGIEGGLDSNAKARVIGAISNMEQHMKITGHDFHLRRGKNDKGEDEYILTFSETVKGEEEQRTFSFVKEPPPLGTTSSGKKPKAGT